MEETQMLHFGPEWLRALPGGGSGVSPLSSATLSSALPKYKLADHRYGREEMLALYVKDHGIPLQLQDKDFLPVLQEEPTLPLALVPFTEEEQRNFSMSVNSSAVLRLTGRGGAPVPGLLRGRSISRGRGRGRGDGGYHQRGLDEGEVGFGRSGRETIRSQCWEERGDRRFEKPGRKDPDGAPPLFQLNHAKGTHYEEVGSTGTIRPDVVRKNWRATRDELNGEEDGRDWRPAEHSSDNDRPWPGTPDGPRSVGRRERRDLTGRETGQGSQRPLGTGSAVPEDGNLADTQISGRGPERANPSSPKISREPLLQQTEEVGGDPLDMAPEQTKAPDEEGADSGGEAPPAPSSPGPCRVGAESPRSHPARSSQGVEPGSRQAAPEIPSRSRDQPAEVNHALPFPSGRPGAALRSVDEDERLKRLEREAERMVASLQERDVHAHQPSANTTETAGSETFPLSSHEAALQWFYRDPQGEIQGPFPDRDMADWFQAGYFGMTLLVKRGCDLAFQPLGDVIKIWGGIPFATGPSQPSLAEMLKRQQELTALSLYQLQQLQYQYLVRQQCAQVVALQQTTPLGYPQQQQLNHLLQQYQALKMRTSEQGPVPPLTQTVSAPEPGSGWLPQGPLSQASGAAGTASTPPPVTHNGGLWDLPVGPTAPPFTVEQLESAAELEHERRGAKMRATEEEVRKRQEEEEELSRGRQKPDAAGSQLLTACRCVLKGEGGEALKKGREEEEEALRQRRREEKRQSATREVLRRQREEKEERREEGELLRRQEEVEVLRKQEAERHRKQEEVEVLRKREEMEVLRKQEAERHRKQEEMEALRKREAERHRKQEEMEVLRKREAERHRKQGEMEVLRKREAERHRKQEEMEVLRKQEAERHRKQEEMEVLRKREEMEVLRKREEMEVLRKQEAERHRKQEEMEVLRKQEAERHRKQEEMEVLRKEEAERHRKQEEVEVLRKREEVEVLRKREVERVARQKELLRLKQQQLAQIKLPSSSKWGKLSSGPQSGQSQQAPSLTEIQKLEEERERQAQEEQSRQRRELMLVLQHQELHPPAKTSGWSSVAWPSEPSRSLLEIQQEESRRPPPPAPHQKPKQNPVASNGHPVWGSSSKPSQPWGADTASIWGGLDAHSGSTAFWDESVKDADPPLARKPSASKSSANLRAPSRRRGGKKVEEEEEKLKKLFQGASKVQDSFTLWCEEKLNALNTANNLDVPVFVSFLKEVDSASEVLDYVRAYLGDTPGAGDFAKHFLERRAKPNGSHAEREPQRRTQPPSSLQSSKSRQQSCSEAVISGKKKRKQKMTRADPGLLGFSVQAASERLNMGDIETGQGF